MLSILTVSLPCTFNAQIVCLGKLCSPRHRGIEKAQTDLNGLLFNNEECVRGNIK